jgi:heme A synthase
MTTTASSAKTSSERSTMYVALLGLASLVVLFQAVWAGLFIREGKDNNDTWVNVHARGADLAIVLAIAAAVVVFLRMRDRRDLLIGTIAFAVALVLEAYLGGLIGDSPAVEVVHFPLALALMGLAVWLPLRARR